MVPGQTRHDSNRIYDLTEETKSVQAPIDTNPDPVRKLALLNAEMAKIRIRPLDNFKRKSFALKHAPCRNRTYNPVIKSVRVPTISVIHYEPS